MSDAFYKALFDNLGTIILALGTTLVSLVTMLVTVLKIGGVKKDIRLGAEERTVQLAKVQAAVDETQRATVKLEEGHEYLKNSLATNTHSTEEIKAMMASYQPSAPAPLGGD